MTVNNSRQGAGRRTYGSPCWLALVYVHELSLVADSIDQATVLSAFTNVPHTSQTDRRFQYL